ncbi:MAG: vanadium-dependent haloperoxidase [Litorimonas sp.]
MRATEYIAVEAGVLIQKPVARYYPQPKCGSFSRRNILKGSAAISVLGLAGCGGSSSSTNSNLTTTPVTVTPPTTPPPAGSGNHPIFGADIMTRQAEALSLRTTAANVQANVIYGTQETNGDEGAFADYRASFTKGLPHDDLGEVDVDAYNALLAALETGQNSDFEAIPMGGTRKLANPQAAYRFELVGLDSHKTFMRPAPAFESAETAAEMGELYWKALCRDVPFSDYDTNALVQAAITDLNGFSETVGPLDGGQVTSANIFRGNTPGDLVGPYISQFLLKDVPYGNTSITQTYDTPAAGDNFMTSEADWLAVQRGTSPAPLVKGSARYISDARALGEFVHVDYSYQAYLNAALILLTVPGSFDSSNVYNSSVTQGGFATLGGPDVLDLVAKAGNLALSGAWYQKWLVHRRLRPEVYGGRLHNQITGAKDYGLPTELVNSDAITQTFANFGSYFLPMAYPEGSPTHPAYPAGHATIAGACTTILKAFFEESLALPDPVIASQTGDSLSPYSGTLTIGDELNKLASNIALGRDWAGVHYRSDGIDGLEVGEQQAIGLLQDYSRTYREQFSGFNLTKFDGTPVNINGGAVV